MFKMAVVFKCGHSGKIEVDGPGDNLKTTIVQQEREAGSRLCPNCLKEEAKRPLKSKSGEFIWNLWFWLFLLLVFKGCHDMYMQARW